MSVVPDGGMLCLPLTPGLYDLAYNVGTHACDSQYLRRMPLSVSDGIGSRGQWRRATDGGGSTSFMLAYAIAGALGTFAANSI